MKKRGKGVIPGFGISLGVTLSILSLVVLIPLASLVVYTAKLSPAEIWETITRPRVLASFRVSFFTALIASAVNAVMGVILAWVLVRYQFPLKRVLDGMIELPFALPTAVAGIALTSLTADTGMIGKFFARFGIQIAYTKVGITVAMIFVGIPLPGTGAWTGSLIASLLEVDIKKSSIAILCGLIMATVIMYVVSYGILGNLIH